MTPFSENHSSLRRVEAQCLARPNLLLFSHRQIRDLLVSRVLIENTAGGTQLPPAVRARLSFCRTAWGGTAGERTQSSSALGKRTARSSAFPATPTRRTELC